MVDVKVRAAMYLGEKTSLQLQDPVLHLSRRKPRGLDREGAAQDVSSWLPDIDHSRADIRCHGDTARGRRT
jgi:hypothetical protein